MTELNEPPTCERCFSEYFLEDGLDPTKYCHDCAHALVDELEDKYARLLASHKKLVEAHRKVLGGVRLMVPDPQQSAFVEIIDAALREAEAITKE